MTHYHTERLEELRKQREELTKEIEKLEAFKSWRPEGGGYTIYTDGEVLKAASSRIYAKFGTERKTRDKMRVFNRLLAYVDEFCGGYEFAVGEDNCYVSRNRRSGFFVGADCTCNDTGKVYMPEQTAIELCEKLNSGEVVL